MSEYPWNKLNISIYIAWLSLQFLWKILDWNVPFYSEFDEAVNKYNLLIVNARKAGAMPIM